MSTPEQSRKRGRTDTNVPLRAHTERDKVLELIRSRGNKGIWSADIKKETNMPQNIVTKQLKMLTQLNLIKEVKDIRFKARKIFMGVEFEPSEEVTGGTWFSGGSLNDEVINDAKKRCKQQIIMFKAATAEMIWKGMKKSDANLRYTMQQIADVLEALVVENEVEEVKSTGKGDFVNVPAGRVCYRNVQRSNRDQIGALASIPCGMCPRLRDCTPDGVISPRNCVYYKKWIGEEDF